MVDDLCAGGVAVVLDAAVEVPGFLARGALAAEGERVPGGALLPLLVGLGALDLVACGWVRGSVFTVQLIC